MEARVQGWDRLKGNLAKTRPGKSIGGDRSSIIKVIYQIYQEEYDMRDANYLAGFRGTERIIYSGDGLIYKTLDHYKTFIKIK